MDRDIRYMRFDCCVLGNNYMEEAIKFYNSLFEKTGLHRVLSTDRVTFWQCENFAFALAEPFYGESATSGNGTMIALIVGSAEEVKRLHDCLSFACRRL